MGEKVVLWGPLSFSTKRNFQTPSRYTVTHARDVEGIGLFISVFLGCVLLCFIDPRVRKNLIITNESQCHAGRRTKFARGKSLSILRTLSEFEF